MRKRQKAVSHQETLTDYWRDSCRRLLEELDTLHRDNVRLVAQRREMIARLQRVLSWHGFLSFLGGAVAGLVVAATWLAVGAW